jgi:hypothetical protein
MKKIYLIILFIFFVSSNLFANAFTPGNIVVVRIGDGSIALSSSAFPVFLEEYTPAGTLVQVIALPIVISGSNKRFVLTGTSTSEGNLTISGDRHSITLAGYDADVGTAAVATTAGILRVMALVSETGVINTTTSMSDGFLGSNIRCSYTIDGTAFWTSGTANPGASGGVRYSLLGSTTSTQISNTQTNMRFIYVYNGQLYASSGAGAFLGVNTVGTGIPTTTGQTMVNYINTLAGSSSYGFALSPDGNTCYIADDRALPNGGVQKWTLSAGVWSLAYTLNTNLTTGCRGLTVNFSGANPVIYGANNINVASVVDAGSSSAFTILLTAATNTVYRGVAFAPGIPVSPPPAPNLASPANNSVGNLTSLNLVWNRSVTAVTYRVQLATDNSFNTLIVNDSTLTDSIKAVSGLSPLTNYWWRVNAKNAGGTSSYSSVFTFRTLGVPAQITGTFIPANGAVNQPTTVNFKWSRAQDQVLSKKLIFPGKNSPETTSNYWFELTTDSITLADIIRDSTLTDTNKTQSGLTNSTTYYWRVKAKNQIGWGSFSFWQRFTTIVATPPAPNLTAPPNNSMTLTTPQLVWDSIVIAASYRVQIASDTLFTSPIKDTSGVLNAHYNVPSGLLSWNVWYYWRVQATNAGGNGPYSVIFRFLPFLDGIPGIQGIPTKYELYSNYPNPFNPQTLIRFDIPKGSFTTLKVYDVLGSEVQTLVNEYKQPGAYSIEFDGSNLASGIYFYRIESASFTSVKKMVLVK